MRAVRLNGISGLRHGRRRARTFPGWWPLALQALLVVLAALCYFGVRGLTRSRAGPAEDHARGILALERDLLIDRERWLQETVIGHDTLVDAANAVYMYGHWPVIAITLAVLFARAPDRYWLLRNAMFASGAIGLVIFALYPVAPPRLGILDIVDTVTQRTEVYRTLQPPGLINRYAAMPSLHFGWNLILGVVVWTSTRNLFLRVFAVAMPIAMGLAVVATGNHYVVDVAGGAVVALTGLAVARALPAVIPVPRWARPPASR
ncbi:phosphatase PAP2 family protein [Miltoncostaea oceani]|uniref:phosphatase PAP2 family protein n=1 Tax=Miltoncostaea oceani TaxID=2843216 RepID=UPI001C3DE56F|nr:phosphatase PAP2 family protein [Miltoncostaea oceani]